MPTIVKPALSAAAVLGLIAVDRFRPMNDNDWNSFNGANAGTLICDDSPVEGTSEAAIALLSPAADFDEAAFELHCYWTPTDPFGDELRWRMGDGGEWEELG